MVAETWLYNPWVVAIGSGILLILFEEIISAYKEKKYTIGHVGNEQRFVAFCFIKLTFHILSYHFSDNNLSGIFVVLCISPFFALYDSKSFCPA